MEVLIGVDAKCMCPERHVQIVLASIAYTTSQEKNMTESTSNNVLQRPVVGESISR
jgi:hypothetical protein